MRFRIHENWWVLILVAAGPLGLVLSGCSGPGGSPTAPLSTDTSIDTRPVDPTQDEDYEPKARPGPGRKSPKPCSYGMRYDKTAFSNPTVIDNPWSPLLPGTQYALVGQADRGGGLLPHVVIFTVTDVTKRIDGITTLALWDRDFNQGRLAEEELAFFAQDDNGNVWGMGEYPEEFDLASGEFQGAPFTWIAGLAGTIPGTLMIGDLRQGKGYYSQGYAPSVEFLDCGKILPTRKRVCVPAGCFDDVLEVDEYGPLDPQGGNQRKFYAKGVGNVMITAIRDPEGETLVMQWRKQLTPAELADARANALRLDARGRMFNDVYAQTEPAQ